MAQAFLPHLASVPGMQGWLCGQDGVLIKMSSGEPSKTERTSHFPARLPPCPGAGHSLCVLFQDPRHCHESQESVLLLCVPT